MNNEKRISFQQKRIEELEKQVRALESENKVMELENQRNMRLIEAKNHTITYLQNKVDELQEKYSSGIAEIHTLRNNLHDAIAEANAVKRKFTKEFEALVSRVKKGK